MNIPTSARLFKYSYPTLDSSNVFRLFDYWNLPPSARLFEYPNQHSIIRLVFPLQIVFPLRILFAPLDYSNCLPSARGNDLVDGAEGRKI